MALAEALRLALFDLDGTLLSGDTDQLWCDFLVAERILDASFAGRNQNVAGRYALGTISSEEFCEFYASTLAGRSPADWSPLRERFVAETIAPRLAEGGRALVGRHRDAGDRLVLTTATSRFLAEPIAGLLGIGEVIASELELEAGIFSGRNRGVLNMKEGKVARLNEWLAQHGLGSTAIGGAVFYSDSINDLPLLRAAGRAVAVDPDERLRAEALRSGWQIVSLAR